VPCPLPLPPRAAVASAQRGRSAPRPSPRIKSRKAELHLGVAPKTGDVCLMDGDEDDAELLWRPIPRGGAKVPPPTRAAPPRASPPPTAAALPPGLGRIVALHYRSSTLYHIF
jgi:hypothetical protein